MSKLKRRLQFFPYTTLFRSRHTECRPSSARRPLHTPTPPRGGHRRRRRGSMKRSEEHTSELQSRGHLVCRLLLVKKKSSGGTQTDDQEPRPLCTGQVERQGG